MRNLTDPKLIIEIGTFDGRTTLNLAVNSPPKTKIVTLDLPPNEETKFELAPFEEYFVNKPVSGERFVDCPTEMKPYAKKKFLRFTVTPQLLTGLIISVKLTWYLLTDRTHTIMLFATQRQL